MSCIICSVPFSGIRPFSISFWNCMYAMKPQALIVQKSTIGTPSSFAALTVNDMFPSETTQLTGGTWTELLLLSLESRFRNGSKQFFLVDSQRDGMSCVRSIGMLKRITRRKAVGDRFEAEVGQAVERVRASGFEQTLEVVLGVDKGYVKASVVKKFG